MSAKSRDEFLSVIRPQYIEASRAERRDLLENFINSTGYCPKYALKLLNRGIQRIEHKKERPKTYDKSVTEALATLWKVAGEICSKRLVPFLPQLVVAMEKCGHLELSPEVKEKLRTISPATVDRLLKDEKKKRGKGKTTTRPGSLLKKHIPIRTFTDWNDVKPGFLEADLVAHCGSNARGPFLNTLTMTDIATGWTELAALQSKASEGVLTALEQLKQTLPFPLLGFDTDNGSEFINHDMVKWCEKNEVTFTRSREYRKNDQAHVEEKNGSIVRRFIGYERYEGIESYQILYALYRLLRLYVNFFQPSQKLVFKERSAARVRKKYDKALTPYERVLQSNQIPRYVKARLMRTYENLDPLYLQKEIEHFQSKLTDRAIKSNLSELRAIAFSAAMEKQEIDLETVSIASAPRSVA